MMNKYGFAVNIRIQPLMSVYGQSYVDVAFDYELLRVCISQIGQINIHIRSAMTKDICKVMNSDL